MKGQVDFILSPLLDTLKDATFASSGVIGGIETYPFCQYLMQTTFLKMTGAQEQKMKCICWEIATSDYRYRYERFFGKGSLSECSTIEDKNTIYKDLVKQIRRGLPTFDISSLFNKPTLLFDLKKEMGELFENSNWATWLPVAYSEYQKIINEIEVDCIVAEHSFFVSCDNCQWNGKKSGSTRCKNDLSLKEIYNKLYEHRNRCAHNTESYQQNLPSFFSLLDKSYRYENYFVRFFVLILIDVIMVKLFKKYDEVRMGYFL